MAEEKIIDIEELAQDQHNFNKGNEQGQQLMERSFKELGAGRSILLDRNGNIIAGNKSQKAAIAAGIKRVRVVETTGDELVAVKRTDVDIDSAEDRKMAYLDNLTTQVNLTWDETELEAVQADVEGFEVADFGFDIEDLPQVVMPTDKQGEGEGKPQTEVKEDDFDPDAHYETKVKAGEVWQLGEHRLMCGDSTDADAVAKLMNGERADLWLTDPPYNVDYNSKNDYLNKVGKGGAVQVDIENDKMSDDEFVAFLCKAFGAAQSVMKEGASFYVWTAQGHALTDISKALDANGLYFRQQLIWVKNNLVLGRSDYQGKHEPCFYGWKAGAAHNWYSDRSQTTVLNFDKPLKSDLHPTMKPVPLFGYQVGNSTKEGDIVVDLFGGSGSTMIACEQLGRKCRMMELDPHYCTVIIARWEKLTGQKAQKLNP